MTKVVDGNTLQTCWITNEPSKTASPSLRNCYGSTSDACCNFVEDAMIAVLQEEMETTRTHWVFHFLWVALWLKAGARKNEKIWQDSLLIAHAIQSGTSLHEIPIMQKICHQSVLNSVETMRDRRTHLS